MASDFYMRVLLKFWLAVSIGCTGPVIALERPSVAAIAANPRAFIGREIGFKGAPCVDDPKGGFLCLIKAGGHTLRIEAGALGIAGGAEVGERLIESCKGIDRITSTVCRFDIEVTPRSAQDEATMSEFEGMRVTRLYSGNIEMRIAHRR